MKQTNISIFIPHYGCPNRCSFCDQRFISGAEKPPSPEEVRTLLSEQQPVLRDRSMKAEIAFFGGSFTAIDRAYMTELLKVASDFTEAFPEQYCGIRCSTRPDCINEEILEILKKYGMTSVELGAQSMNDEVLRLNDRGHTAAHVEKAARLIKAYGFSLGLQMMTGLYGDKKEYCIETAERFIELDADTVRIYPTVILKGTRLGELYEKGEYKSFSFDETVDLCAVLLRSFNASEIPVIRLGLHASREVEEKMLGGVYHPALREIVESRIFCEDALAEFRRLGGNSFIIHTDGRNISKLYGQKKENKIRLSALGYSFRVSEEKGAYLRIEKM